TGGAPRPRPYRRATAVLLVAALAGAALGWNGAGSWRRSQEREIALGSATAAAAVVAVTDTAGAPAPVSADGGKDSESGRGAEFESLTATLVVRVTNLGDVPLEVLGGGGGFSAVRVRFLEPSGATLRPRGRLTVRAAVEVACASPQVLTVPPLRVVLPDGRSREVPVDAATPAVAELCASDLRGAVPLVVGAASPPRTSVAELVDNGRFRLSVVAPSGRTTRIVGVAVDGIEVGADPLPMTVDGTPRAIWLDQPGTCEPSVARSGLPRAVDLEVDAGTGQPVTVRLPIGDAFTRWLLDGVCGRAGTGP
ncbi:hypothetical protein, partial [Kineosporia sp. A_224]|uniref:hypothetical protein n=1 Tax=Kineosporia sp. A_224 TaxID=1962180 RepID=UPI0013044613